jgi:hypothetical protein
MFFIFTKKNNLKARMKYRDAKILVDVSKKGTAAVVYFWAADGIYS